MTGIMITFVVRAMLVGLFLPFSALDKIMNFRMAVGQAAQAVPRRWLAVLLTVGGLCVEVLMSLAILTGVADRLAALVLAGYCLATAVVWKPFWTWPDFRLQGVSRGRDVFWDFLKNIALASGFLLLTFGADASGVQRFLRHPLASSHPYTNVRSGA